MGKEENLSKVHDRNSSNCLQGHNTSTAHARPDAPGNYATDTSGGAQGADAFDTGDYHPDPR